MVAVREVLRVPFGVSGSEAGYLRGGWAEPEPGFRWMTGSHSRVELPADVAPRGAYLVLEAEPLTRGGALPKQDLAVTINASQARWALTVPTLLISQLGSDPSGIPAEIDIRLDHPDAAPPSAFSPPSEPFPDSRILSVKLKQLMLVEFDGVAAAPPPPSRRPRAMVLPPASDLSDAELLMHFASIGDNCEFGLFQRRLGAEPTDLLRFSGIALPSLIAALDEDFSLLCKPEELVFELRGEAGRREYVLYHRRYKLLAHTTVLEGRIDPVRLIERELKKLVFLRRMLLRDLASGNRIFLFKQNEAAPYEDIVRLHRSLSRHGDIVLLYVAPAEPGVAPGTVGRIGERILRGHMDRFLDYMSADGLASDTWLPVCRNAYQRWAEMRHVAPLPHDVALEAHGAS